MTQELRRGHLEAQRAYESAKEEGGLVRIINESSLKPAEKGVLLALYEQGGRVIYRDMPLSFAEKLKHPPKPSHNPSLLHDSSIFMNLTIEAMRELTLEYGNGQLEGAAKSLYESIQESIQGKLPGNYDKDTSKEIADLLQDFYEWHILPTLTAARRLARIGGEQSDPKFKNDIRSVKDSMDHIHQDLLKRDPYDSIVEHAPKIMERINPSYIDKEYLMDPEESTFLVNLYAAAYLLDSTAKKWLEIKLRSPKKEVPLHAERYRPDPIVSQ